MKEKEKVGPILILIAFGMLVGVASSFSVYVITAPPEEQVSIQEEGGSVIDTLPLDCYRNIRVYHDNRRNVTCWIDLNKGGISCIPDHMLTP